MAGSPSPLPLLECFAAEAAHPALLEVYTTTRHAVDPARLLLMAAAAAAAPSDEGNS
jgi:hypothetical protein